MTRSAAQTTLALILLHGALKPFGLRARAPPAAAPLANGRHLRPQHHPTRTVQYPNYDPQSPLTPLTGEEIAALDKVLQNLATDTAMSLDGFDGYLTAFAIGPAALLALPSAEWLPLVWGGDTLGPDDAAPFPTKRQRKNTVVMSLRHLRHLSHLLHQQANDWEPIFSVAESGPDEFADAREWCMGFLQAVDLMPDAWGDIWAAPELSPLLLLGGGLQGAPEAETTEFDLDDPVQCDELSRAVPDLVLGLMEQVSR